MANARGEVVESPTQHLPFKAVISTEGEILRECYFASRPAAEAFIVDTLKGLGASAGEHADASPAAAAATGEVIETPTQDMPFKAVISTEGKILQERFFASRPEAEAYIVDTLRELAKPGAGAGAPRPAP